MSDSYMQETPEELAIFRLAHWPASLTPEDLVVLKRIHGDLCQIGLALWRRAVCPEKMREGDQAWIDVGTWDRVQQLARPIIEGAQRKYHAQQVAEWHAQEEAAKTAKEAKRQARIAASVARLPTDQRQRHEARAAEEAARLEAISAARAERAKLKPPRGEELDGPWSGEERERPWRIERALKAAANVAAKAEYGEPDAWAQQEGADIMVPYSLAPVDVWYEQETALYRVPAVSQWAFGRHRPHINRLNEGKPGRRPYTWAR
jgi:hypothetical protein